MAAVVFIERYHFDLCKVIFSLRFI